MDERAEVTVAVEVEDEDDAVDEEVVSVEDVSELEEAKVDVYKRQSHYTPLPTLLLGSYGC